VVEQRAYLPTYDGTVHEIELARGGLLGRFRLGQHLTVGGAYEPDTKRLYFPADDSCVYVLDAREHRCVLILYTDHPSGSLRSEPLLIPPVKLGSEETSPGFLVLNQAEGLDAVQLRVYELPLTDAHAAPKTLDPPARLPGWTWFRPREDGEKVAILSDTGMLGLFGIRQPNNKDQALFPLLKPGGLSLESFLPRSRRTSAGDPAEDRGRAQVVQMQGGDFWVLAHGQLQRLELVWSDREGPRVVAGWKEPLNLGSPLHASQVAEDVRRGRSTLFLVTQPLRQQTCVATAVDDESGQVLWQRQLGVVCQGEPLRLAVPGGPPLVLALDQGGSTYALDPARFPSTPRAPWQSGGQTVAPSLTDNPRVAPLLLPAPDGQSAYEIACPGAGTHLVVRQIEWSGDKRQLRQIERSIPLPSPLAGTPAVVGPALVLPLAGGTFGRLPLPLPADARLQEGPDWRVRLAPPDAVGHVTALAGGMFLTTDGGRDLKCWQWPAGDPLPTLAGRPKAGDTGEAALSLKDRVVSAPLALPAPEGGQQRVCVVDNGGVVTLIAVRSDGTLEPKHSWDLRGRVTAGPFLRAAANGEARVGCVVDGERLVWLDPNREEEVWRYRTGGKAIVGQPQVVEGLVVVADLSGRFVALDPATGKPQGPGYQLPGSVVPAATPIAFGPWRVFAPLSDGTALLLTLDRLHHPLRKIARAS
jgi:hypothetical protein